jgi:hypothetical protein
VCPHLDARPLWRLCFEMSGQYFFFDAAFDDIQIL